MPASEQISETVFQETITRAVQDVFKTMLGLDAVLMDGPSISRSTGEPWDHPVKIDGQQVIGTVGFVGEISGLIYLYLDLDFARDLSCQILGMDLSELEDSDNEVINDSVGELTNMTVGAFKNQLCDQGYPCRLTIPSILRGSNFTIEPTTSATRRIYQFLITGKPLIVDLLMKHGD